MRCDHCAHDVPDGVFCTRCGAHQGTTGEAGDPKTRVHRYAAHPGEHVAQPSIVTTLFPHLGQHKVHEFRWALIAGLAGVLVLYVTGLIAAAILVSAFLVPVLYLVYLYEAQVYRDEPATVLGFTIGAGFVVGLVLTLIVRITYNPFASSVNPLAPPTVNVGLILLLGLLVPVIQEAAKAAPAVFLLKRDDYPETVDGLVFGVASGLGFAAAETLINFSTSLTYLGHVAPGNWVYNLTTIAVLQPLMQASATGMVVATVWRQRLGKLGGREIGAVVMAVLAHVAFSAGTQILSSTAISPLFILFWQAAVDGALLVYVRYLLHHALLEEAAHMGFAETVCPNCHMHIVASGFCPNCGMALTAAPSQVKRSRRERREPAVHSSRHA
ncbi:MAG TPA: PrsW family glutamic-type intramembrane protease [Candidatus Dormibacteraeota bacterium]|nr:PrsW family glutamic-type intramembrane protease [Candidatus Dormibacteraeota bacterium]